MSYDPMAPSGTPQGVSSDRAIQLISEAEGKKGFFYRTLFGNKYLPQVVHQIEHLTLLDRIVPPRRRITLQDFYDMYRNTLTSTTSIDGKTMYLLTETRVRHTTTENRDAKKGFGGGRGGGRDALRYGDCVSAAGPKGCLAGQRARDQTHYGGQRGVPPPLVVGPIRRCLGRDVGVPDDVGHQG